MHLASAGIVLVSVEVLGRALARTDAHDLVSLPFLALGIFAAYRGLRPHAMSVSGALASFVRRVRAALGRLDYPDGLDLRERPPLPRSIPYDVALIVLGLPALGAGLGALAALAG